jgi:hypothetical protein
VKEMPNLTGVSEMPFLRMRLAGIEECDLLAAGAVVRTRLELLDDVECDIVLDLHAVGRYVTLVRIQIDLAYIERIASGLHRDRLDHALGEDHALRSAEAPERSVGDCIGHQPPRADADGWIEIGIVRMEHGAVANGIAQIGGIPAARKEFDIDTRDTAFGIEAGAIVDTEVMALAGHDHVFITVEPALCRPAGQMRRKCGKAGPLRGLAFLATKTATHAAAFGGHTGVRNVEHVSHAMLHLTRVLRRAMTIMQPFSSGKAKLDLPLQIEMFLSSDQEGFKQAVRGSGDACGGVFAGECVCRQHVGGCGAQGVICRHDGV